MLLACEVDRPTAPRSVLRSADLNIGFDGEDAETLCDADDFCSATGTVAIDGNDEENVESWFVSTGPISAWFDSRTGADIDSIASVATAQGIYSEYSYEFGGALVILAADNLPAYLLVTDGGAKLGERYFGDDFAKPGEPLGTFWSGSYEMEYGGMEFSTDEGTILLGPGEVGTLYLSGVAYRAGVIVQTARTDREPEVASKCPPTGAFEYELLRIEVEDDSEAPEREAGKAPGTGGC